jgi:tetratricopeptide (TPR) repeat protein
VVFQAIELSSIATKKTITTHLIQMEDQIRNALADKDYAVAQSLADDWLSRAPDVACRSLPRRMGPRYTRGRGRRLVHYEKAFALGLSAENLRGALLGAGSTYRNLGRFDRSEEILRRGIQDYVDASEFAAFLALTLYCAGRFREAVSILLKLVADTTADVNIQGYTRALRYYAANPDAE